MGVVFDGTQFAGQLGGADDIDAGDDEQADVWRPHQESGELPFQLVNLPGFREAIVIEVIDNESKSVDL
jgi:hypothetical protein